VNLYTAKKKANFDVGILFTYAKYVYIFVRRRAIKQIALIIDTHTTNKLHTNVYLTSFYYG